MQKQLCHPLVACCGIGIVQPPDIISIFFKDGFLSFYLALYGQSVMSLVMSSNRERKSFDVVNATTLPIDCSFISTGIDKPMWLIQKSKASVKKNN